MSCLSPRKAFIVGKLNSGKKDLVITNYAVKWIEEKDGKWISHYKDLREDYSIINHHAIRTDYIDIPCGKCKGCKLDHSKEWANRILMEMEDHEENYFITLTYDDEHIPLNDNYAGAIKFNTGEIIEQYKTLNKKHLTTFIKRLRGDKYHTPIRKFRYFACGEYG